MGYLFILGYVLIVGIATFLIKVGLKTIDAYQLNFLMGIGMFIVGIPALLIANKSFKMPVKELPLGMLIGVMMAGGSLLFVLAFSKFQAGVASVLASTYVLIVIVLSVVFLKEGITWTKVAGILLTLVGVGLLTLKA
jgi:drug/metabolite transporter (DMT)-like permease